MMFNATRVSYKPRTQSSTTAVRSSSSSSASKSFSLLSATTIWGSSSRNTSPTESSSAATTESTVIPASTSITALQPSSSTVDLTSSTNTQNTLTRSLKSDQTVVSYTRSYVITESSTTFTTALSRATVLDARTAATFTAPTAAATTDVGFYNRWLSGTLDSNSYPGSISKHQRTKIIASVVGSVGGFLLIMVLIWFFVFRRRKNRNSSTTQSFSHDIGCRIDYPLAPTDRTDLDDNHFVTNRSSDEDEVFMKGKYKSFGRKLPLFQKSDAKPDTTWPRDHPVISPDSPRGNPFQDEFDFQKRLPLPPPVPTRDVPIHSNFSYNSEDTSSSDISSDTSSSIQLSRPHGAARSTQSFLREVL
ncbi:LANO_0H03620g1_1 [Lachancea nothofagi CBS 11611]|uniref:LANO_0H03620g1_1 n=1 Tax=Lachancea nothofagi CBS 11611 TaxID=1266666 RepID=A0A1G4KLA3_9SACH|nr:LANO_0H03620g1_1 [Lachancea nothofagi CBS 11611]